MKIISYTANRILELSVRMLIAELPPEITPYRQTHIVILGEHAGQNLTIELAATVDDNDLVVIISVGYPFFLLSELANYTQNVSIIKPCSQLNEFYAAFNGCNQLLYDDLPRPLNRRETRLLNFFSESYQQGKVSPFNKSSKSSSYVKRKLMGRLHARSTKELYTMALTREIHKTSHLLYSKP